jgi:uncharacterized membrane protein HdeD (DUF308 family)
VWDLSGVARALQFVATILFFRGLLQIVAAFGILSRKDWGRKLGIAFGILDLLEGGVALLHLIACIRNTTPSPADIPLVGFIAGRPDRPLHPRHFIAPIVPGLVLAT